MDERLKKIIEEGDRIRDIRAKEAEAEEREKRAIESAKNLQWQKDAALWVNENIFSLIERADHADNGHLYFADYTYSNKDNYGCQIPARFIIAEIKKIDGLRIKEIHNEASHDPDGPSYPAYWSYEITWRPEKRKY